MDYRISDYTCRPLRRLQFCSLIGCFLSLWLFSFYDMAPGGEACIYGIVSSNSLGDLVPWNLFPVYWGPNWSIFTDVDTFVSDLTLNISLLDLTILHTGHDLATCPFGMLRTPLIIRCRIVIEKKKPINSNYIDCVMAPNGVGGHWGTSFPCWTGDSAALGIIPVGWSSVWLFLLWTFSSIDLPKNDLNILGLDKTTQPGFDNMIYFCNYSLNLFYNPPSLIFHND